MSDRITFKCVDCGAPVTSESHAPHDHDIITCAGCGRKFGTYAEVKEAMIEAGKIEVDRIIDEANLPGWVRRTT